MRPTTLWRYRRPLMRWGAFLCMLAFVAAGLWVMLPPEPRWEKVCDPSSVFNAGGGRIALYRAVDGGHSGPLQLLDAATGSAIAQFLDGTPTFSEYAQSGDGRYFVALVPADHPKMRHIRGVDLHEQREWHVETLLGPFASVTFSPRCDFVARLLETPEKDDKQQSYVIRKTKSGRIAARVGIPAAADQANFSRDGGCFVLAYHDEDGTHHIRAVSTRTGKAITLDSGRLLAAAPDARCVIADRGDDGVWIGDLTDGSWRACLDGAHAPQRPEAENTPGYTRLATTYYTRLRLSTRRRAAVARFWSNSSFAAAGTLWADVDGYGGDPPVFSPDGQYVLWHDRLATGQTRFTLHDAYTGRRLWQRTWDSPPRVPLFTPDSQHLVVPLAHAGQVEVVHAAAGSTGWTITVPGFADQDPQFACDGRTLTAVATFPEEEPFWLWAKIRDWLPDRPEPVPLMAVRMFDFPTGAPLGEVICEETSEWWLTDDRRGVITVYQDDDETGVVQTVIQCWDIPPHRPLRWIIGVPLAVGVSLVALRRGWLRWRASRKPALAAGPNSPATASG